MGDLERLGFRTSDKIPGNKLQGFCFGFGTGKLPGGMLPKLPSVQVPFGLELFDKSLTDDALKRLRDLENLTALSLVGTQVYGCWSKGASWISETSFRLSAVLSIREGLRESFVQSCPILGARRPGRDWVAVVIYPSRSFEQKKLQPYRMLLKSDQLVRIYLDELPPAPREQIEMGVLELITASPERAVVKAKQMVQDLRASEKPEHLRQMMIQFIETVVLYQFPHWTREKVEKMVQVTDIRLTRVYKDAVEEGIEKAAKGFLEIGRPVAEVAQATGLSIARIRKLKKEIEGKSPSSDK